MSSTVYLGVDDGTTRSRARLRDAEGKLITEATGSIAIIHVDFSAAEAVRTLVDATLFYASGGLPNLIEQIIRVNMRWAPLYFLYCYPHE